MQAYVDALNHKLAVFRDVIIEGDYDPLKCAQGTIEVATGDVKDPLDIAAHKAACEAAAVRDLVLGAVRPCCVGAAYICIARHAPLFVCASAHNADGMSVTPIAAPHLHETNIGQAVQTMQIGEARAPKARTKTVLPTQLWATVESTPYGHNTAPDGSAIVKPVDEKLAALQRSRMLMDHYTYPRGNEVRGHSVSCACRSVHAMRVRLAYSQLTPMHHRLENGCMGPGIAVSASFDANAAPCLQI